MATSFTDPQLAEASDRVLVATRPYFARLQRAGIDLSPRPEPAGATIKVPLVDVGTAASYDRSENNYADTQGSCAPVAVTLSSHPKITFGITAEAVDEYGNAVPAIADAAVEQAAQRIGSAALLAWHNLLPAASATTGPAMTLASHTSGAAMDKGDFSAILQTVLEGTAAGGGRPAWAGAEPANCDLVLSASAYATACSIYDASNYRGGDGPNPTRDGWFDGGLLGFRSVLADPKIGSSVVGYVVPAGSIAYSGRAVTVRNPAAYASFAYRRDDRSGVTFTFRELLAGATDDRLLTVEAQFGGVLALPGQVLTVKPHA